MPIVIMPAYKPDKTLIMLADKLWNYGCRIIVVNDGSGEEYQSIFDRLKENCIILSHSENRGKGAAIKSALAYVETEMWDKSLIGIMDCDGQHLPEDMMKVLAEAGNHRESLILGVREVGKDMPLKSRLGNRITRMIFHMASGVKVSDTQTGLRAFSAKLLRRMRSIEGERYEYEMNVLMTLAKAGIPIREVPIHTIYRDKENSTSHFRAVFILIMNNLILEFLVQFCHVFVYLAKLVTECMLFFISWLVQNCIIFRKERRLQKVMD